MHIPDTLYKFQNQNLITFEDYLKYKADLPFIAYCDFETTTTTEYMFDWENREMFAVSYAIIFAFDGDLNIDKIVVERSSGHSLEKLIDVSCLKRDILLYGDRMTKE